MVNSSNPSLNQSRREVAPSFSKGKTRKIPCEARVDGGRTAGNCGRAEAIAHRARHTTRQAETAKVLLITGIVTEREWPSRRCDCAAMRLWQRRFRGFRCKDLLRFRKFQH